MLSFMYNGEIPLEFYATTGNTFTEIYSIDKNLDEKFDEEDDKEVYDFQYAVLTSRYSFSCANLLPCAAQDNGVVILGETSSGGACNFAIHFLPDGSLYTVSGSIKLIHANGRDYDSGAAPDVPLPGYDDNYEGFWDIDAINAGIDSFYSQKNSAASETEAEMNKNDLPSGEDNSAIAVIVIAVAAFVIIDLIVIILLIKKKKKKAEE